jgi:hypothetical protein
VRYAVGIGRREQHVRFRALTGPLALYLVGAVFSPLATLPGLGCRGVASGRGDDDLLDARRAAALSWVNALAAGDAAKVERATTDPFVFRGVGTDRHCEGRVAGSPAFAAWLACARARPELQLLAEVWKVTERTAPDSPERAAFAKLLPRLVGGDEAWSRFVGAEERSSAQVALDGIVREAGRDGAWITIAASWLSTNVVLRLQVVGPIAAPRVHAVLVNATRSEAEAPSESIAQPSR